MYDEWAKENLSEDHYQLWKKTKHYYGLGNRNNTTKGRIIAMGKHKVTGGIICAVLTRTPGIYLINQDGLRSN